MILRRLALFVALLFGVGATQLPEFFVQYKQALNSAVGELSDLVSNFDSRVGQHGLSEAEGVERLKNNTDPIAREDGAQMQETIARLDRLRAALNAIQNAGPVARLGAFALHYDQRIAQRAASQFEPAVPTSAEAFVLGLLGFVFGGGALHVAGRPFRRRRERAATAA